VKLIWESFVRAAIRFFDQRSLRNDQVEYLRMEIEKLQNENRELRDYILRPVNVPEPQDETVDWQPLGLQSWEQKRRELEAESRKRMVQNAFDSAVIQNKNKSTEQLEKELLTGTD